MIHTKELKTLEDFQSIKKGDTVACEFHRDVHDYPKKSFRFKVFTVFENKHRTNELIWQKKNNIYSNYGLLLGIEEGESNLKSATLIYCDEKTT